MSLSAAEMDDLSFVDFLEISGYTLRGLERRVRLTRVYCYRRDGGYYIVLPLPSSRIFFFLVR